MGIFETLIWDKPFSVLATEFVGFNAENFKGFTIPAWERKGLEADKNTPLQVLRCLETHSSLLEASFSFIFFIYRRCHTSADSNCKFSKRMWSISPTIQLTFGGVELQDMEPKVPTWLRASLGPTEGNEIHLQVILELHCTFFFIPTHYQVCYGSW